MNLTVQYPFVNLPIELVLLILAFAARPNFVRISGGTQNRGDRYSSALKICRVSRDVRRTILPVMLETVILEEDPHMMAFYRALRMQKEYARHEHHLWFDYIPHICKIWVGKICKPRGETSCMWSVCGSNRSSSCMWRCMATEPDMDFNILAPVLLAAPSLALDGQSLYILDSCLQAALRGTFDTKIWRGRDQPHWRTNLLTLSGYGPDPLRVNTSIDHGSSFFTSLSRVIFVPLMIFNDTLFTPGSNIPDWMRSFVRSTRLRVISMPRAFIEFPDTTELNVSDMRVHMLTFSPPLVLENSVHFSETILSGTPPIKKQEDLHKFIDTRSGEGTAWQVKNRPDSAWQSFMVNWEEGWVCGNGVWSANYPIDLPHATNNNTVVKV
ncbi:hypothetical protein K503DRAFT_869303 [Rhizopogon vinicolor AM-OR11-026]|uniref:F-box domain-containing protein n=1 Tax=Rhizopogon vinicolor AM-OR11-026 TaxID=1314800 RepID=A0A1B7MMH6_9AGAM|nr:hypothetical protein K503DRAFT_869303 [Rhizopogon vinicolor AM-OR11-026]